MTCPAAVRCAPPRAGRARPRPAPVASRVRVTRRASARVRQPAAVFAAAARDLTARARPRECRRAGVEGRGRGGPVFTPTATVDALTAAPENVRRSAVPSTIGACGASAAVSTSAATRTSSGPGSRPVPDSRGPRSGWAVPAAGRGREPQRDARARSPMRTSSPRAPSVWVAPNVSRITCARCGLRIQLQRVCASG